jgi:hypothetical protein
MTARRTHVPAAVSAYLAGIGARGGAAGTGAAKARTPEQARAAVAAREAKRKAARTNGEGRAAGS